MIFQFRYSRPLLALSFCAALTYASSAYAQTGFVNASLQNTPQPKPIMGTGADVNSGAISLEGDKQLRIFRNSMNGVKIWRFVLDNAYWWVTQRGVIWGAGTHAASSTEATLEASSDEQAYARYLAM